MIQMMMMKILIFIFEYFINFLMTNFNHDHQHGPTLIHPSKPSKTISKPLKLSQNFLQNLKSKNFITFIKTQNFLSSKNSPFINRHSKFPTIPHQLTCPVMPVIRATFPLPSLADDIAGGRFVTMKM
jgi:hypothetical protein